MAATATHTNEAGAHPWTVTLVQPAFDLFVTPNGAPPVRTWEQLRLDLEALRALQGDWDGQGAAAPPPAVVDGAEALASGLEAGGASAADRVIAGANGTVLFEWHGASGYVEVEVTAPDRAEGRWVPAGANRAVEFYLVTNRSLPN